MGTRHAAKRMVLRAERLRKPTWATVDKRDGSGARQEAGAGHRVPVKGIAMQDGTTTSAAEGERSVPGGGGAVFNCSCS